LGKGNVLRIFLIVIFLIHPDKPILIPALKILKYICDIYVKHIDFSMGTTVS